VSVEPISSTLLPPLPAIAAMAWPMLPVPMMLTRAMRTTLSRLVEATTKTIRVIG
jgi:hypothetical protein